ncbi:MAG: ABC transporter permease, partial [Synergistaceae bacterium]|nr:ABC transporter permease [Synergistaceae bacterium]
MHTFSVVSVIAVSSALAVALFLLVQGLRGGLTRAVEPFDLIIGAKGSPYQLVLNTVFLRDVPIGNVEWSDFAAVSDDPRVSLAIPLAFGDGYEGFPVVGTTPDILGIAGPAGPWLRVGEGRWFEGGFEAVFGAQAAAGSGARVGESFRTSHGVVAGDRHDALFKCVGIAERTNGPYDRAIFVSLRSVWANHRH